MNAAVAFRILSPRMLLGGSGDPNSLENVIVGPLESGAVCWVLDQSSFYRLDKTSGLPVSAPAVIATGQGASNPARWIVVPGTGGVGGGLYEASADTNTLVTSLTANYVPVTGPAFAVRRAPAFWGFTAEGCVATYAGPAGQAYRSRAITAASTQ